MNNDDTVHEKELAKYKDATIWDTNGYQVSLGNVLFDAIAAARADERQRFADQIEELKAEGARAAVEYIKDNKFTRVTVNFVGLDPKLTPILIYEEVLKEALTAYKKI